MRSALLVVAVLIASSHSSDWTEDQWLEKEHPSGGKHSAQADGVPDEQAGNRDGAVPVPTDTDHSPELIAAATTCKEWCAKNEKSWDVKCTYTKNCAGCSECASAATSCVDKSSRCTDWKKFCFAQSGKRYQVGGESLETYCAPTCTGCAPTPTPPPTAAPTVQKKVGTFDCTPVKSVAKCGKCMGTDQCASGYCCPYMKKCVEDANTGCYYPIASCRPMCHKSTIADSKGCSCSSEDFPSNWVGDTCA